MRIILLDNLAMRKAESGSILEYTLEFLTRTLDTVRARWNSASKTGLIEITSSKEFHRIYSGVQFVSLYIMLVVKIMLHKIHAARKTVHEKMLSNAPGLIFWRLQYGGRCFQSLNIRPLQSRKNPFSQEKKENIRP